VITFKLLCIALFLASAFGIALIAQAVRDKFAVKVFIFLYIILSFYWAQTGISMIKESVTCTVKEKS
jgi:hypothetical protein